MRDPFELHLFATDEERVQAAERAGIDRVVVDLERRGKQRRQRGRDTDITSHDLGDLRRICATTTVPVVCRINPVHSDTPHEVAAAIDAGAAELLVPMVRSPEADLDQVLEQANDQVAIGCMVETVDAVARVSDLSARPVDRVYIGLNDLAIDRGAAGIFEPFVDGTVEHVGAAFPDRPLGVAGLTRPTAGSPLPCRHLVHELARVGASFTFLRRSFIRDVTVAEMQEAVDEIRVAIATAWRRTPSEVARDRLAAHAAIRSMVHT